MVVTLLVTAVVLVALLVGAVVTVVVLRARLEESTTESEELRHELALATLEPRSPRAAQAAQAAGYAVRTVVETATRLREHGFRGTIVSSVDDFIDWAMEDREQIVRVAAPDGTVTILFSDIENSTALNTEIGDAAWVRLLNAHDDLLSSVIEKFRGHIVKSQGDGYMVVFSTPDLATDAALEIQRALSVKRQRNRRLRRTPIRVRIGLHTGRVIEKQGDYFGRNVALAARIAALADGGETLVSSEIVDALTDEARFGFTEVDTVELKGLPGEHRIWLAETA